MQTYNIGKNRTKIQLQYTDFLAEGGQAKVYAKGNLVYKIYHDPKTLIPEPKLKELSVLKDIPEVILPKDQIYDAADRRVGFVFDWIKNAQPLYNMGSNGYWLDHGMTADKATKLIDRIIKTIELIHQKSCLIVDLNPFNILVDQKTLQVHFFIDTEPWQTMSFPATVIMPGIRDWQSKDFTTLSDWFSFAVISCEFFLGVHPFKSGVHPRFGPKDMELRMKNNAPIFDKNVRLNSRIRPFDIIPTNYLNWYVDLFLHGKRTPPPSAAGSIQVKKVVTKVVRAVKFEITLLQEYPENIIGHSYRAGKRIVKTAHHVFVNNQKFDWIGDAVIVENNPIFVIIIDGRLELFSAAGQIKFDYLADDYLIVDNKIFVKNGAYLAEIVINNMGSSFFASIGQIWDIMPNASKLFDGIVIQNMLGKPFFVIPGICKTSVNELVGCKIITAKRLGRLVVVIANKNGQDYQLIFSFSATFDKYSCFIESAITKDINCAFLEKNVLVAIQEDGKLFLRNESQSSEIEDSSLQANWNLSAEGNSVVFFSENKLYQLKMK